MSQLKFTKVFRQGHAVPQTHRKRANSCATGGFYKSPTAGQTVSSSDPLNITWDPTCLSTNAVDIYLYAPGASNPRIHLWQTVDFAAGSYQATIKPKWWNATNSVNLQLSIVQAGSPPFLATLPAGPVFTATYSPPASGHPPADADVTAPESAVQVVDNLPVSHHISKGKIAAAVIMPLLIVGMLAAYIWIKINRKKGKTARQRFSQAVDARMSTINPDWASISHVGAQAAIRASMAVGEGGNRTSVFSFGGGIRPISTAADDGGHAGIGAQGKGGIDTTTPQMTQLRSGPRPGFGTGERVSRVSFAVDTRPSTETRRSQYSTRVSRTSRAFHVGHVPPVPHRQNSGDLSPTQAAGPLSLTAADISARMSGIDTAPRPSVDEVMPALTMMRTGLKSTDDLLLPPKPASPPLPSPPPPVLQNPKPSPLGNMPMQPMPANMMSPDEMLRAYAQSRAVASPPPTGNFVISAPIASYNGNTMRTLYSPTTPNTAAPMLPDSPQSHYRQSLAPTEHSKYDEDDAYVGTAE